MKLLLELDDVLKLAIDTLSEEWACGVIKENANKILQAIKNAKVYNDEEMISREEAVYILERMKTWSKDFSDEEIEALQYALKYL